MNHDGRDMGAPAQVEVTAESVVAGTTNERRVQHIAVLVTSLHAGGAERVMLDLCGEFTRRGISVDVLLIDRSGPLHRFIPTGVRVIDFRAGRALKGTLPLMRYLRDQKPDVLVSAQSHANVVAVAASRVTGVTTRVVLRETTIRFRQYGDSGLSRLRRWALLVAIRILYRYADALVCVSEGVTENFTQHVRVLPRIVTTIYNPVVNDALFAQAREPVDHPWVNGERPLVVAAGRLVDAKDYPTLLRAFAVVHTHSSARLIILGEGQERLKLERLVAELGLQGAVAMPGFVINPIAYMARADVFAMSSVREGLPGALIQGLACGCRVVSTDCRSGPREILEAGRLGWLVPVGDSAALGHAILEALVTPEKVLAPQCVVDRFGAARATDAYLDVVNRTLRG
jgi:glycosyltransferase involved in cell wall biosynthesis